MLGLNETPIYEFGYGLSYTNFSYSNILVTANDSAPAYTAATGYTSSAPTYGTISSNIADHLFPAGFQQVFGYIYPFLNASTLSAASADPQYGINYTFPAHSSDSSPQPILPAGGAPGGNPRLYDILFTVTATVTNTGSIAGEEVPQLYVSLGGPNDAKVALRQFDKFEIAAGASETFTAQLTRKDLSNWDTVAQDWFISTYPKTVHVGSSSRKLPLSAPLPVSGTSGGIGASGGASASGGSSTSIGSGNSTYTAPTAPPDSSSVASSVSVSASSAISASSASARSSYGSFGYSAYGYGQQSTTW